MEATQSKPRRTTKPLKALPASGGAPRASKTTRHGAVPGQTQALAGQQASRPQSAGSHYAQFYQASSLDRIHQIRDGVPARVLVQTGEDMGMTKERMVSLLSFSRATVNRRIQARDTLPAEYSERIIGLQKLVGQVEVMVTESGDPTGFNAAHWVAEWLERPLPALNHARPADFMDTMEGQALVSSLLAKMQSGAYA